MRQQLRGQLSAFNEVTGLCERSASSKFNECYPKLPKRDAVKGKKALAEMRILREQMNPWLCKSHVTGTAAILIIST